MITNTKVLFAAIVKYARPGIACDIGSRDGAQSMLLRHLLPNAEVWAFEANPINYQYMVRNQDLKSAHVRVFAQAISKEDGVAKFHITDVDYEDPSVNTGTSSLLLQEGRKVREAVQVETRRLDALVKESDHDQKRLALWIDVEGAEYGVLEGISGIADRIDVIHVEVAERPKWDGQRPLREVEELMRSMGFDLCGSNIKSSEGWGDVVFIRRALKEGMGFRFRLSLAKGYLSRWLHADYWAVFLKERMPWAYRLLRAGYLKLGT